MRATSFCITAAVSLFIPAAAGFAAVIHVNAAAPPGGDGKDWNGAFNKLQDALAVAIPGSGDQLWVVAGTYRPAGRGGDRTISFNLVSGTELYGGFNGTETALEQRDPAVNLTILSGDLNSNDTGPADDPTHEENSFHVIQANGTAAGTIVDGVAITGGFALAIGHTEGGGGLFRNAEVHVNNCTVEVNYGHTRGGGFSAQASSVLLANCRFRQNITFHTGGGGLYAVNAISTVINDCEFSNNQATNLTIARGGGAFIYGGVVEINHTLFEGNFAGNYSGGAELNNSQASVTDCRFIGNTAYRYGGGLLTYSPTTVTNCRFIDNHAGNAVDGGGGGAIAINSNSTFVNCLFAGNTTAFYAAGLYTGYDGSITLINCVFSGNAAAYLGGALAVDANDIKGQFDVINCTFANNSAHQGGGAIARLEGQELGSVNLTNCLLWNNVGPGPGDELAQIFNGVTSINYSCVQGWTGALGGVGNFSADPLFIDADGSDDTLGTEDDNLRLGPGSGSIDLGNIFIAPPTSVDFDGRPRLQACVIDQGAFELQAEDPTGPDCNRNLVADVCEIAAHVAPDCNVNFVPDQCDIAAHTSPDLDLNGTPDECQAIPANNTCISAAVAHAGTTVFTTVHATTDGPVEPAGCGFGEDSQVENDIWFKYPAQCAGIVTISLCGATYDARLAVYIGCPSQSGQMVACSDNDCGTSPRVNFQNPSVAIYRVRVGGAGDAVGGGTMVITCTPSAQCPGDANGDGNVNITDLLLVISNWGQSGLNPADVNADSIVNVSDLLGVIAAWGSCT